MIGAICQVRDIAVTWLLAPVVDEVVKTNRQAFKRATKETAAAVSNEVRAVADEVSRGVLRSINEPTTRRRASRT